MSLFSEQLQRYLSEKQMSVYTLSKASGIERSFVHRIANGKRFPSQQELVERLSLGLMLSPSQKEELMRCYQISKIGENVYSLREAVCDLFSAITPPTILSLPNNLPGVATPLPPTVNGAVAVQQLLRHVLDLEATIPNGDVRVLAQPGTAMLMSLLQCAAMASPTLRIRHIFCFDNMPTSGCINMRQLSGMMAPLLACPDYRAFYYHDFLSTVTSTVLPLPLLVITSQYALQLSSDCTCAVCVPPGPVYDLLCASFDRAMQLCSPLVKDMNDPVAYLEHYRQSDLKLARGSDERIYELSDEPCLIPFFTPEIYAAHLLPFPGASQMLLDELSLHSASFIQQMSACKTVIYCTLEGFCSILRTGRINEIPPAFYRPFSVETRRTLLNAFITAAEEGLFDLRLYAPLAFPIPAGLTLTATTSNTLSMVYAHPQGRYILLDLREPTISAAVSEYLESLTAPTDKPPAATVLQGPEAIRALRRALDAAI